MNFQRALWVLLILLVGFLVDSSITQKMKKSPCPKGFPIFEINQNHPDHGDVCRQQGGRNYRCPRGCYKSRKGKPPFCQQYKWNKLPCRSEYKQPPTCAKASYPNFESYQGIPNHGDVCRHNDGKNYRCPTGCFKPQKGRKPFCLKSKWNKQPCRVTNFQEIDAGTTLRIIKETACFRGYYISLIISNKYSDNIIV